MSILNYFRRKTSTASVAKERLQIIISHERSQRGSTDYLPKIQEKLQEEILAVIAKYIPINRDKVTVNLDRLGDSAVLELNVIMPEEVVEN